MVTAEDDRISVVAEGVMPFGTPEQKAMAKAATEAKPDGA